MHVFAAVYCNTIQATGYASQHIWCMSQARLNWGVVVPGRASGVKMVGMAEMGHQLVWMGWQFIWIVGTSACVIFILHQTIQKMAKCTFWYQLTRVPGQIPESCKMVVCVCLCVCCNWSQRLVFTQCQNFAVYLAHCNDKFLHWSSIHHHFANH